MIKKRYRSTERAYDDRYRAWRKAVLDKCNSCCVRCGSYKEPHCHHIKGWAKFPELRFDVDNGEVLCKACHHLEHPFMVELERKELERIALKHKKWLERREIKRQKRRARKERKIYKQKKQKSLKQYRNYRFNKAIPNPNWSPIKFDEDMQKRLSLENT